MRIKKGYTSLMIPVFIISIIVICISCGRHSSTDKNNLKFVRADSIRQSGLTEGNQTACALLILPRQPAPGTTFRIITAGSRDILKAETIISSSSGTIRSLKNITGGETPCWRIDDFPEIPAGEYIARVISGKNVICTREFKVAHPAENEIADVVWKADKGWDSSMEILYSAWINALFYRCDEKASWSSLHDVIQNGKQNFLYNYLSLDEDDPERKNRLVMQPDCADNPFFLRAYFSWKLGLPFGYHVCDRGAIGRNPLTGEWITNESHSSGKEPVQVFNSFLRKIMDGVHSGTARTSLDNENSDYYPVALESSALRPGVVYADPYGHTFTIVSRVPQTKDRQGLLLAVDAQPDGTIGIKRFWRGNFLFSTSGVIGEPGFKAFRPIAVHDGHLSLRQNSQLTESSGFVPFSLQQRNIDSDTFYGTMERIINPSPLDPETTLVGLIEALHEQLIVRLTSVSNGDAYLRAHPGTVIEMPSGAAGVFLAGGLWESYSTPNRDLRLLIAMDEVLSFPDRVSKTPGRYNISSSESPAKIREKLLSLLKRKTDELTITYTRSDGSEQKLTVAQILERRDAFEMAYNPNDCIEIRWGAPEGSAEHSTCRRRAPSYQKETMLRVRSWFSSRQHPPT